MMSKKYSVWLAGLVLNTYCCTHSGDEVCISRRTLKFYPLFWMQPQESNLEHKGMSLV